MGVLPDLSLLCKEIADGLMLTGPSGCGKTTLLQCIVGKRLIDAGSVLVFGGAPGSRQSGVPGPRVGYMPQELALYGEFTIKETLQYFGRWEQGTEDTGPYFLKIFFIVKIVTTFHWFS